MHTVNKFCITQGAQINGYSRHKSYPVFRVNEGKSVDRTIELVAQKLGILSNRLKPREMLMLDVGCAITILYSWPLWTHDLKGAKY